MKPIYVRTTALAMCSVLVPGAAIAQEVAGDAANTGDSLQQTGEPVQQDTGIGSVIVVTAQKREQDVQDVPIAISAYSGEAIREVGATNVEDVADLVPNFQIKTLYGVANPNIFLRGVGFNDFAANAVSAVGIYTDEIYVGPATAQLLQFYDLDRLEVLKGPQGTLYGRNTTGGLINLSSRKPTETLAVDGEIRYGRFDEFRAEVGVGGPIVEDVLGVRVAGFYENRDGYVLNRVTGNKNNAKEAYAGRIIANLSISPSVELQFNASYAEARGDARQLQQRALFPAIPEAVDPTTGLDGGPPLCASAFFGTDACTDALGYVDTDGDIYAGDYNVEGRENIDALVASVRLNADLGFATLTSITGWVDTNRFTNEDSDGSPNRLLEGTYVTAHDQFTQEIRLASNGEGSLQWIAGAYYLEDEINNDGFFDFFGELRPFFVTPNNPTGISLDDFVFRGGYPYRQTTESWSVFAQADLELSSTLTATVGLRYTDEEKDIRFAATADEDFFTFVETSPENPGPIDPVLKFDNLSGRFSLNYQPSDNILFYGSYSRGFKSGGFNAGFTTELRTVQPFDEETLDAYEVGIKSEFLNGDLRINAAAFIYDYQDLQVFTFVNDQGTEPDLVIDNASDASISGAELEITAYPLSGFTLLGSVGYLDTQYENFFSDVASADFSGNRLPSAPRWSLSGLARYNHETNFGSVYGQVDANYQSKVFFETANRERLSQDGYGLVNLRFGLTHEETGIDVSLWAENVFGKNYLLDTIDLSSFGYDQLNWAEPSTYGVAVSFSY